MNNSAITSLYALASRVSAVAVMLVWALAAFRERRPCLWVGLPCILWFYASLLFSTELNRGSIYHVGMSAYPVISICMLTSLACRTREKMKRFIHTIANLFFIIAAINLVLFPVSGQLFSESHYFLGHENGLGYPLNLGLLFCILDYHYNQHKVKYAIYLAMYCITIFAVFSGSNVVGALIILSFLCIKPLRYVLQKVRFPVLLLCYSAIFLVILLYSDTFLSWGPMRYIVTNFLGKDVTMTHRTVIWATALMAIVKSPYFGYGVQESVNVFYMRGSLTTNSTFRGMYSAHNQILQTLYEGGMMALIPIAFFLISAGGHLKKMKDEQVSILFKVFLLSTLVLLMAEASAWNLLFYIGNLSIVMSKVFQHEEAAVRSQHVTATALESLRG